MQVRVIIEGVDRTSTLYEDWSIDDNDGSNISTMELVLDDQYNTISIRTGIDIVVEDFNDSSTRYFGGIVVQKSHRRAGLGRHIIITCQDYKMLLDRATFSKGYSSMMDRDIIRDAFLEAGLIEIDTSHIMEGRELASLNFEGATLRNLMDVVSSITAFPWNIDFFKRLRYGPAGESFAPFTLHNTPDSISSFPYYNWSYVEEMGSFNEVEIRGGVTLSDDREDIYSGDGSAKEFVTGSQSGTTPISEASDGESRVGIDINTGTNNSPVWESQDVGIEAEDTLAGTIDVLWNPLSKLVTFQDAPPNLTNSWRVRGRYRILVTATQRDEALVFQWGRILRKVVIEPDLTDTQAAIDLAEAFLNEHGTIFYGKCSVDNDGLRVGMIILVTSEMDGLAGHPFHIQTISTRLLGHTLAEYQLLLVDTVN